MQLDIFIPTLNETRNIRPCVLSIRSQRLPSGVSLRIAIVDAGSTDDTCDIARDLNIEILDNSRLKDPEAAKQIALRSATGDFLLFMDADMQCAGPDTLAELLRPLLQDPNRVAAFGRYVPRRGDPAINRCISMNAMQCDPLYQALVTSAPKQSGDVLYSPISLPPIAGTTLYRRAQLASTVPFTDRYFDVDAPVHLISNGFNRFYYSRDALFYHEHVRSFRQLVQKRLRNLNNGRGNGLLTVQAVPRVYSWLSVKRFGRGALVWRLLVASSGIGLIPRAIYLAIAHRDWAGLLLPIIGPTVALTLAVGLLRSEQGRHLLISSFSTAREQS